MRKIMLPRPNRTTWVSLTIVLVVPTLNWAQESPKKAEAVSAGAVEVRFADGGSMRMNISEDYVDLVTPHGKLRIATAEIRRIDMATRIPEATQRLIEQSIANLGSPQYKLREKASNDLIAQKERSYPAVHRVSQSKDAEIAKRAKDVLEKIRELVPAQRLKFRDKDVVFTSDSTISGRLELNSFSATTQQFGA